MEFFLYLDIIMVDININIKSPSSFRFDSITPILKNSITDFTKNYCTKPPPPLPPSEQVHKQPPPTPHISGNFHFEYNQNLKMYIINVYLGNAQRVSLILDTSQFAILVPTQCCINRGCLLNPGLGSYNFQTSPSCMVLLPNQSYLACENEDCYTITTLQRPEDEKGTYSFGTIKKVTAHDYLNFNPNQQSKQKVPLTLIMGYFTNEGYLRYINNYIPPTLGIGPANILNQNYIYLDLQNNILSFDERSNPKHKLLKGISVSNAHYSGHVTHIIINKMKLNSTNVDVIFDTGTELLLIPGHMYKSVMMELRNHSNIPFDSRFWRNGYLLLNNLDQVVLPDITFIFETTKGPMKWILKKENYVINIEGNKYALIIEPSKKNITFGNLAMKGRKYGFHFDINKMNNSNTEIY